MIVTMAIYGACTPSWTDLTFNPQDKGNPGSREESIDTRKVMLLYIAGYNNLQSYLSTNIYDLTTGWIPKDNRSNDVLLVFSHLSKTSSNFSTPTVPVLTSAVHHIQHNQSIFPGKLLLSPCPGSQPEWKGAEMCSALSFQLFPALGVQSLQKICFLLLGLFLEE